MRKCNKFSRRQREKSEKHADRKMLLPYVKYTYINIYQFFVKLKKIKSYLGDKETICNQQSKQNIRRLLGMERYSTPPDKILSLSPKNTKNKSLFIFNIKNNRLFCQLTNKINS